MDLAQLKFVVDTSELKNAATEIEKLSGAVNKLNKPLQEVTTASKELNKEQQASAQTSTKSTESTRKQTSVLERQQMILEFMAEGYSKGQASQLAYAKAAGALTDELQTLGTVLQTQRKLMGTDPFDKSIGAMQALKNEYIVTKEVQRLYNAELGLSKSQMEDLAREKLRLIEKYKIEGASLTDIKNGLMELNMAYIRNASAENAITQNMKDRQKAANDAAKANDYIIREMDRVNRLTQENGNITSATNNALIRFEKALKLSGMSASDQVEKLEAYKQSLLSVQKAGGQRQVDYLSRALGPQITDIFVGLATGQSPMMVLLQQGGQLRDQFALAGVAGRDMADMLVKAMSSMITSVKDIGLAIGQLLVRAVIGAGESILNLVVGPMKALYSATTGLITGTLTYSEAVKTLTVAMSGLGKTGVLLLLTTLAALAIEYVKVTQANTDLSKAIALTGASIGMTRDEAVKFAETLTSKTGGSTLKYIGILTEFAKAGASVSEEMIKLADDMQKYLGQSIDTTAKQFVDLGDSPTKALVKIAKEQGFVTEKTLQNVYALEQAGNKTEAAKLATEAYLASQKNAVAEAKKNLDPLQRLWLDIKSGISQATQAVYDLLKSAPVVATFRTVWETVAVIASEVWYVIKQTGKEIGGIAGQIAAVIRGDFAGAAKIHEEMKSDAEASRKAQDDLVASILKRNSAEEKGSSISAAQAKANSDSAKTFEDRMKTQKEAADYFASVMKEINKIQSESTANTNQLNTAQKKMIDLLSDPKFNKLSRDNQILAFSKLATASATIEEIKALEVFNKIMKEATKMETEAAFAGYELNAAQKKMIELSSDPVFLRLNDEKMSEVMARLANVSATLEEVKAQEQLRKQNADLTKSYIDRITKSTELAINLGIASDEATRAAIMEGEALDYQTSILSKTERERNRLLKIRQIELELDKEKRDLDKQIGLSAEDREALKADAAVRAAIKINNANKSIEYDKELQRVQAYGSAFENVFIGMADAIINFAKTGKLNFSDLINTMIMDITRFELRRASLSMYEGFGGASGIFGAVKNMFISQADGGAWMNGIKKFANGGTFTNSIVDSPTLFKFAKGTGLMGEAGPEAIMPLTRDSSGKLGVQASGSGSNVSVQVINNTNATASTRETVDSKGNRKVEVVIGEMTASEIARSGSSSQKSIRSTFGIVPQLIRR